MAGHVIEREAPVVAPVTTRDVLHRAADLLEEFGWVQCDVGGKDRGFCVMGAVIEANKDYGRPWFEGFNILGAAVWGDSREHSHETFPIGWNNAPGRTKAEVVARLREAAEAAA